MLQARAAGSVRRRGDNVSAVWARHVRGHRCLRHRRRRARQRRGRSGRFGAPIGRSRPSPGAAVRLDRSDVHAMSSVPSDCAARAPPCRLSAAAVDRCERCQRGSTGISATDGDGFGPADVAHVQRCRRVHRDGVRPSTARATRQRRCAPIQVAPRSAAAAAGRCSPPGSTMTRTGSSPARTATTATRRSGPGRSRSRATGPRRELRRARGAVPDADQRRGQQVGREGQQPDADVAAGHAAVPEGLEGADQVLAASRSARSRRKSLKAGKVQRGAATIIALAEQEAARSSGPDRPSRCG